MSATVTVGDTTPITPKACPTCPARGEWPGRLCPDCKPPSQEVVVAQDVVIAEPRTTAFVQPEWSLDQLAEIANEAHARVRLSGRELVEAAICVGDALLAARARVDRGQWLAWAEKHLTMEITTAYRYMRIAEFRQDVLASDVHSIEGAIRLLADRPRRGHGPRGYTDADKADWIRLADEIGVKPAARAVGVSPSTMHAWTSPKSPSRGKSLIARQVTEDRIERLAEWLVDRFGGFEYPERVNAEVRVDAATALGCVFAEPER